MAKTVRKKSGKRQPARSKTRQATGRASGRAPKRSLALWSLLGLLGIAGTFAYRAHETADVVEFAERFHIALPTLLAARGERATPAASADPVDTVRTTASIKPERAVPKPGQRPSDQPVFASRPAEGPVYASVPDEKPALGRDPAGALGPASYPPTDTWYYCALRRDHCVIDGDTFVFRGETIRIADIDTPETKQAKCETERARGGQARARLRELLNAGDFTLTAWKGRDEDRYGRKLRVVLRDGKSLGGQLVSEGLARAWTGKREPWCS